MVDAVAGELLGPRSGENEVTLEASVHDLDDDLAVREANNQAVLGSVAAEGFNTVSLDIRRGRYALLVLRLGHQPLAGVVCIEV